MYSLNKEGKMKIKMFNIFSVLFFCFYSPLYGDDFPHCKFLSKDVFNNCSRTNNHGKSNDYVTTNPCIQNYICNRTFTVSYIQRQAFKFTIRYALNEMMHHCCGSCIKMKVNNTFKYASELDYDSIVLSDIVYPILGRHDQSRLYGHYFIPAFDLPTAYLFTQQKSKEKMAEQIVDACTSLWPLLVICILAAVIAGFILWTMETRYNTEEFPSHFIIGLFEGFWWGFVSMTTVGYGDKSPRTFFGRIFAIFWILIGITICSIFTASITSEVIDARKPADMDMSGEVIGCLNYRLNDAVLIAQNGGIVHTVEYNQTTEGIGTLHRLLIEGKIKGFLLNKQTYYDYVRNIRTKPEYAELARIARSVKLLQSEVKTKYDRLSYGLLIKRRQDYDYFRKYFENNWLHLQTCHNIQNNRKDVDTPTYETDFFSPEGGLFTPSLYFSLGLLGLIFILGGLYEFRRYSLTKKTFQVTTRVGEE